MTTEAEIKSWIATQVRNYNGLCQALMWQLARRFGSVQSTPHSAIAAYQAEKNAGRIRGGTPPPGAFVYWDIGDDGHVGFMLNGGRIFMGSRNVDQQWSDTNTGPQGLSDYNEITGATYLGWSYQNGGNSVPFTPDSGTAGGGGNSNYVPPKGQKGSKMFIAIRKGSWYLITPAANGKNFASVLGGQDKINGLPTVEFVWDTSWSQFKSTLSNPGNVPK